MSVKVRFAQLRRSWALHCTNIRGTGLPKRSFDDGNKRGRTEMRHVDIAGELLSDEGRVDGSCRRLTGIMLEGVVW